MIGRNGERGSGISALAARHDDDDDLLTRREKEKCRGNKKTKNAVDLRGAFNKFPDFFVLAFKIAIDS